MTRLSILNMGALIFLLFIRLAVAGPFGTPVTFSGTGCAASATDVTSSEKRETIYYRGFGASTMSIDGKTCTISIPLDLTGKCFAGLELVSYMSSGLPRNSVYTLERQFSIDGLVVDSDTKQVYGPLDEFIKPYHSILSPLRFSPICGKLATLRIKTSVILRNPSGAAPAEVFLESQDIYAYESTPMKPFAPVDTTTASVSASTATSSGDANSHRIVTALMPLVLLFALGLYGI